MISVVDGKLPNVSENEHQLTGFKELTVAYSAGTFSAAEVATIVRKFSWRKSTVSASKPRFAASCRSLSVGDINTPMLEEYPISETRAIAARADRQEPIVPVRFYLSFFFQFRSKEIQEKEHIATQA